MEPTFRFLIGAPPCGYTDCNSRAFLKFTRYVENSAVEFDEPLGEREAQADAFVLALQRVLQLRKGRKRCRNVLRSHADACIAYGQNETAVVGSSDRQ